MTRIDNGDHDESLNYSRLKLLKYQDFHKVYRI